MLTPIQIRMARAALGWGVRDLAKKAGLAPNTVSRFETAGAPGSIRSPSSNEHLTKKA